MNQATWDAARARIAELEADLAAAREEARKWEWCLDYALQEREIEMDTRTDAELKTDILARYQPADREGE